MAPSDGVHYVFTPVTAILTSKSFENPRWVFEYSSEMCSMNCLTGMASMSSAERRQYRLNGYYQHKKQNTNPIKALKEQLVKCIALEITQK